MQGKVKGAAAACGRWKLVCWRILSETSSKLCPLVEATALPLPLLPAPADLVRHRHFLDVLPLASREHFIPFLCSFIHSVIHSKKLSLGLTTTGMTNLFEFCFHEMTAAETSVYVGKGNFN